MAPSPLMVEASCQVTHITPVGDRAREPALDEPGSLLRPPGPPRPATLSPVGTAGPTGPQTPLSKRVTKISLLPWTNSGALPNG